MMREGYMGLLSGLRHYQGINWTLTFAVKSVPWPKPHSLTNCTPTNTCAGN
jgi:hypothetical protein